GVSIDRSGRIDGALMMTDGPEAQKVRDHSATEAHERQGRNPEPAELFRRRINQVLRRPFQALPQADPTATPPNGKRRRLSEEERRAKVMRAARDVFVKSGMNGARTKQIALKA